MSKFNFDIIEEYAILIAHFLMKKPETELAEIQTIMTHPQVIKQCTRNLAAKYPEWKLTSGEGDLVDSATAAKALAEGRLPANLAVMGPEILSKLYGLEVIEGNLQDSSENWTSFMMVRRPVNSL
jgi:prephenate dehydratase